MGDLEHEGQTEGKKPEVTKSRAEQERDYVLQEPYAPTPEELDKMSVEQVKRWIELGAHRQQVELPGEVSVTERDSLTPEQWSEMSRRQKSLYLGLGEPLKGDEGAEVVLSPEQFGRLPKEQKWQWLHGKK